MLALIDNLPDHQIFVSYGQIHDQIVTTVPFGSMPYHWYHFLLTIKKLKKQNQRKERRGSKENK